MNKPKLIVVPNDPLVAYERNGFSESERHLYFNPNKEFDVAIFSVNYYTPSFCKNESIKKYKEYAGFKVYNIKNDLSNLSEALDDFKPDLVRGYTNGTELAIKIGKVEGVPSFTSVHNLFPEKVISGVDRIFAVSNKAKEKCMGIGIDEEKIKILPDRVNMEIFYDRRDSQEVEYLNKKYPSKYKIVSAGRLNWQKNLENLFEASDLAKKELGYLKHIHIGNYGDQKKSLVSKISSYDHIKLLGNMGQESLSQYFSWADAFAMASISEGFGLVYTEALASGTPVITSDLNPMKDYVINEYNGTLVNQNSPKDIAAGIVNTISDKNLLSNLKKNARGSVMKFDSKILQKREASLYKELL